MVTPPLPWQPVPMSNNPFGKEVLPKIQPKTPLAQLKPIPPCPVTRHVGEQISPHLATASFKESSVESDKVAPEPPFLQAE